MSMSMSIRHRILSARCILAQAGQGVQVCVDRTGTEKGYVLMKRWAMHLANQLHDAPHELRSGDMHVWVCASGSSSTAT